MLFIILFIIYNHFDYKCKLSYSPNNDRNP